MTNLADEVFELADIFGQMALFVDWRIDPAALPPGLFRYELRYGSDDSLPATMEKQVMVNFLGTIITGCDFHLDQQGAYVEIGEEDFGFTGEDVYLAEYQQAFALADEPLPPVLFDKP